MGRRLRHATRAFKAQAEAEVAKLALA
jgi:hypothetical protein